MCGAHQMAVSRRFWVLVDGDSHLGKHLASVRRVRRVRRGDPTRHVPEWVRTVFETGLPGFVPSTWSPSGGA